MTNFSMMVCLVMGIAQLCKKMGLNTRLIPLVNVLVATALSLIFPGGTSFLTSIQQGLLIGLAASGMYDVCMSFIQQG